MGISKSPKGSGKRKQKKKLTDASEANDSTSERRESTSSEISMTASQASGDDRLDDGKDEESLGTSSGSSINPPKGEAATAKRKSVTFVPPVPMKRSPEQPNDTVESEKLAFIAEEAVKTSAHKSGGSALQLAKKLGHEENLKHALQLGDDDVVVNKLKHAIEALWEASQEGFEHVLARLPCMKLDETQKLANVLVHKLRPFRDGEEHIVKFCENILREEASGGKFFRFATDEMSSIGTFLRGNSLLTNVFSSATKFEDCRRYLRAVFSPLLLNMMEAENKGEDLEIEESKLEIRPEDIKAMSSEEGGGRPHTTPQMREKELREMLQKERRTKLLKYADDFLDYLTQSVEAMPSLLRDLCRLFFVSATQRFKDVDEDQIYALVGSVLFLRYLTAALVTPELNGLGDVLDGRPSSRLRRNLILLAKLLQNLSNNVEFGSKEEYMTPLNAFIVENRARVKNFVREVVTERKAPRTTIPTGRASLSFTLDRQELVALMPLILTCPAEDAVEKMPTTSLSGEVFFGGLRDSLQQLHATADDWKVALNRVHRDNFPITIHRRRLPLEIESEECEDSASENDKQGGSMEESNDMSTEVLFRRLRSTIYKHELRLTYLESSEAEKEVERKNKIAAMEQEFTSKFERKQRDFERECESRYKEEQERFRNDFIAKEKVLQSEIDYLKKKPDTKDDGIQTQWTKEDERRERERELTWRREHSSDASVGPNSSSIRIRTVGLQVTAKKSTTEVASSTTLQLVDAAVGLDDDEEMDEETLRTLYEKESYLRRKFEREVRRLKREVADAQRKGHKDSFDDLRHRALLKEKIRAAASSPSSGDRYSRQESPTRMAVKTLASPEQTMRVPTPPARSLSASRSSPSLSVSPDKRPLLLSAPSSPNLRNSPSGYAARYSNKPGARKFSIVSAAADAYGGFGWQGAEAGRVFVDVMFLNMRVTVRDVAPPRSVMIRIYVDEGEAPDGRLQKEDAMAWEPLLTALTPHDLLPSSGRKAGFRASKSPRKPESPGVGPGSNRDKPLWKYLTRSTSSKKAQSVQRSRLPQGRLVAAGETGWSTSRKSLSGAQHKTVFGFGFCTGSGTSSGPGTSIALPNANQDRTFLNTGFHSSSAGYAKTGVKTVHGPVMSAENGIIVLPQLPLSSSIWLEVIMKDQLSQKTSVAAKSCYRLDHMKPHQRNHWVPIVDPGSCVEARLEMRLVARDTSAFKDAEEPEGEDSETSEYNTEDEGESYDVKDRSSSQVCHTEAATTIDQQPSIEAQERLRSVQWARNDSDEMSSSDSDREEQFGEEGSDDEEKVQAKAMTTTEVRRILTPITGED